MNTATETAAPVFKPLPCRTLKDSNGDTFGEYVCKDRKGQEWLIVKDDLSREWRLFAPCADSRGEHTSIDGRGWDWAQTLDTKRACAIVAANCGGWPW